MRPTRGSFVRKTPVDEETPATRRRQRKPSPPHAGRSASAATFESEEKKRKDSKETEKEDGRKTVVIEAVGAIQSAQALEARDVHEGNRTALATYQYFASADEDEPSRKVWMDSMAALQQKMIKLQPASLFSNTRKGDEEHAKRVVDQNSAALQLAQEQNWTTQVIPLNVYKQIHGILCAGLLADAGRFRKNTARIGDQVVFVQADKVAGEMLEFAMALPRVLERKDIGLEQKAAWAMYTFITIHPFSDGNGRMARILGNCVLSQLGLPFLVNFCPSDDTRRMWSVSALLGHKGACESPLTEHVETIVQTSWSEFKALRLMRANDASQALPKVLHDFASKTCCICLCDNLAIDHVSPCCGVSLHLECLLRWLSSAGSNCPQCRKEIDWKPASVPAPLVAAAGVPAALSDTTTTAASSESSDTTTTTVAVPTAAVESDTTTTTTVVAPGDVCVLCGISRPLSDFSRNQIVNKAPGNRKCKICLGVVQSDTTTTAASSESSDTTTTTVSVSAAAIESDTTTTTTVVAPGDVCVLCGISRPLSDYSRNQIVNKTPGNRKCKICLN